ncbi:transporter substrate-binding domain-containing protein [Desulfuromonas sp. TF]|uniref:ATP-binding protein n=1 Tax=Desulfuromonas sp. TF TaxID=1232410 RepID=UPI000685F87F|nr:transporter substrate-binding domain-containing protein [Desulfuromonas sp. TF]
MRRFATIFLVFISILLFLVGPVAAETPPPTPELSLTPAERNWLEQHPVIRVRIGSHNPPFEYYSDGRYHGMAYDYLVAVTQRLGIEFRPVPNLTWSEALEEIRSGRSIDLILLITRTSEREEFLEFTQDYMSFPWVIFTTEEGPTITGLMDLAELVVAVERDYITQEWLKRDLPGVRLLEYDHSEEALTAVSTGQADAYVGNLAVGSYFIEEKGLVDLKIAAPTPYGSDRLAMGVRRDWSELADLIDKALDSMTAQEHRDIRQKWLSVRYEHGIRVRDIVKWTLLVGGLSLIWILYLRLAVKRRTAQLRREVERRREKEKELEQRVDDLRDAHQRLSFHVQRMPVGYIVWDTDLRVVEWNPAAERIFGWSAAEAQGKHAYDLIVPADIRPAVDKIWKNLLEGRDVVNEEGGNIRKDGQRLICEWYNTPLRDPSGHVIGILSMVHDITERRRTREALQSQFAQISTIFDSINAVVSVSDMGCHELIYLNRYGISVFGEDWRGKPCYKVLQVDQEVLCSLCTCDQLVKDGVPQGACVWEFQNTGTGQWYQCIDRAIPWPDGRLVRMVIAFDITERKEVERIKDEIISAVSHEMRTPLTAVMGYSEYMLEHDVPPDKQKVYMRTIYQQTEKLNEMIDAFLSLQRLRARQTPLTFKPLRLRPLLKEAATLFGTASPTHRIILDIPGNLPPVRGDINQLQQMLACLVSNAVKYSPAGGEIVLGARRDEDGVTLWVKDQGVGIPPAALEKIFDRFYRVDNTDRRLFGGTGLGLALVREIVNLHGGRVWVESTLGEGSTFYVMLPVSPDSVMA